MISLAADVASDLILMVDLHDDFRRTLHQTVLAPRTLPVVSFAAHHAEHLAAIRVLALLGVVYNLLAHATQKVFVELVDWRVTKS